MVKLKKINEKTFRPVVDMKLPPEQAKFVAPNVVSLAQAWLYREARPFAVLNDGEPVGFLMLDWDKGERTVGVWRFMIAKEHQHRGYGRAALTLAIEMAKRDGNIDMMHLDYVPGNTVARELYYSLGFRENGDEEDGEIIMTLPLTDAPRLGCLTADEDDAEEICELVGAELQNGGELPEELKDSDALCRAIASHKVKRLTLMGETVGIIYNKKILLSPDEAGRADEAQSYLQ